MELINAFFFFVLLCLGIAFWMRLEMTMAAVVECEKHLRLLAYHSTKRDREQMEEGDSGYQNTPV